MATNDKFKGKKNYRKGPKTGRKPYRNDKDTAKSEGQYSNSESAKTGINDFAWYNRNPALTVAAASLPFPYRPGMDVPAYDNGNAMFGTNIPGVMALNWCPTVGQSARATDPASIAAKEVFAQVRATFSGSIEADPPDFIIYLLALDSIFSYIGGLKRIYRILNSYNPNNYQIPDALLRALGLSDTQVQAWRKDKTLLWQQINMLIGMTRKFRCPAVFDIFNRHYWMNDNVYADDASANSQMYVMRQVSVLAYQVTGDPVKMGNLAPVQINYGATPTDAFEFGRHLIDNLSEGDDAYIISGYLTRAYADTPVFTVDELQPNEVFTPLYVPEVLMQLENSMTVGGDRNNSTNWNDIVNSTAITQDPDTNSIISTPLGFQSITGQVQPMLSIRSEQPSVTDVIEATRLAAYVDANSKGPGVLKKVECATELPLNWEFYSIHNYYLQPTNAGKYGGYAFLIPQVGQVKVDDVYHVPETSTIDTLIAGALMSAFDWSPRILIQMMVTNKGTDFVNYWDVHNTTSCTLDQLSEIHRVCLLSQFNSFNA